MYNALNEQLAYAAGMELALKCAGLRSAHTDKLASTALVRVGAGKAGTFTDRAKYWLSGAKDRISNNETVNAMKPSNMRAARDKVRYSESRMDNLAGVSGDELHAAAAQGRIGKHRDARNAAQAQFNRGVKGWAGVGTAGLAVPAVAYGMGDADTYENRAARTSNAYLGTNIGTTSRFGNMFR